MQIALLSLMGAALGGTVASYLGVVLDRGWAASTRGRSHCDACGRPLRWFELVPVGGYLAVRGRCRTCAAALPRIHLLRETAGVAIGAALGAAIGVALGR